MPALLLHGGPAVPDYLRDCATALDGLFATIRYTQRGTPPSGGAPPYTIEAHVTDALTVLSGLGVPRAWVIGHSWGGHLALHLALLHPERVSGLLLIDALGPDPSVLPEQNANLRSGLAPALRDRLDAIDHRRREGKASERDLVERFALIWPRYFASGRPLLASPARVGTDAMIGCGASITGHLEQGTLVRGLPRLKLPVLIVHGELDPIPVRSAQITASLIPGSMLETIAECGHFPWLEQPARFRTALDGLLKQADV